MQHKVGNVQDLQESALAAQSAAISEEHRQLAVERAALEATLATLSKRVAETDHQVVFWINLFKHPGFHRAFAIELAWPNSARPA